MDKRTIGTKNLGRCGEVAAIELERWPLVEVRLQLFNFQERHIITHIRTMLASSMFPNDSTVNVHTTTVGFPFSKGI